MIKTKLRPKARYFKLKGINIYDLGSIRFSPSLPNSNEIVSLENGSGSKCDIAATNWGYYLGPSLNSRLVKEGFRAALMLNNGNQLYMVVVEKKKMRQFKRYLEYNEAVVLCWLDEWLKFQKIKSPHKD